MKNCENKILGIKYEEHVESLKIGEVNHDFRMDLNEYKTDKEDYLGLINQRSGSCVNLLECGKRVKIKNSQRLNVYPMSKTTHENSGSSSFQVRKHLLADFTKDP